MNGRESMFKLGFLKKCAEHGMTYAQGVRLYKSAQSAPPSGAAPSGDLDAAQKARYDELYARLKGYDAGNRDRDIKNVFRSAMKGRKWGDMSRRDRLSVMEEADRRYSTARSPAPAQEQYTPQGPVTKWDVLHDRAGRVARQGLDWAKEEVPEYWGRQWRKLRSIMKGRGRSTPPETGASTVATPRFLGR